MHTIHPDFIPGIGRISEFGARKYHMRNFLMAPGMTWSSTYESLLRHMFAFWGGEENDDESGLPHLLHAAWNVMALYSYSKEPQYAPGDDRPSTIEYKGDKWENWKSDFDDARGIVNEKTNAQTHEEPFEMQLQSALATLEALGFAPKVVNECGETPEKVLSDYAAGGSAKPPAPVFGQREPKNAPAFMKDFLRPGMTKNNGDKQP